MTVEALSVKQSDNQYSTVILSSTLHYHPFLHSKLLLELIFRSPSESMSVKLAEAFPSAWQYLPMFPALNMDMPLSAIITSSASETNFTTSVIIFKTKTHDVLYFGYLPPKLSPKVSFFGV